MTETEPKTEEQQLDELVAEIQAIKAPLDEARTKSQQEAKKLKLSIKGKLDKLKGEIKSSHAAIKPLDELARTASAAKRLRGKIRGKVLTQVQKELEGLK